MPGTGQNLKGGGYARQRGPSPLTAGPPALTTPPHSQGSFLVCRGRPFFFARKRAQARGNTTQQKEDRPMTTATMATGTRTAESELRAAARRRGVTMKELAAMMGVSAGYLSQLSRTGRRPWTPKMRQKARGGPGRGPWAGDRLPPGRRRDRREQLHPGARTRPWALTMHDLADRVGVSYGYMTGGRPRPRQHGRQGPGPDRVGAQGPGQDRSRTVRQPPGERGERAEQLRPGARPRPGHDHAGACRAGRRVRQLHVDGVTGPQEHGREGPGAGRGGAGGRSDGRVRAACLRRPEGLVGPDGRSRDQPERGRTAGRHQLLPPLPDHEPASPARRRAC